MEVLYVIGMAVLVVLVGAMLIGILIADMRNSARRGDHYHYMR